MNKFTITPTSIGKMYVQASNEEVLSVTAEIKNSDNETVYTIKHAFPLTLKKEEIIAELKKVLATYESDLELAKKSAAAEESNANAQQIADELTGATI